MLFFIVILITGLLWGVSEGITMIQCTDLNYKKTWLDKWNAGARSHKWFGQYHLIDSLVVMGAMVIGWMLAENFPSWMFLVGAGLLGWQMKETGYAFSRWHRLIAFHENINFFDTFKWQITALGTYIITAIRIAGGITFILRGVL